MPFDHRIDGGDDCLSLAALVPPQISALVELLDRVVIEHAGEQRADDGPRIVSVAASRQPRPIAFSTARSYTATVSRRTSCGTPPMSCFNK
jgi:hypothetical protein